MMARPFICVECQHAESLHDVWGICSVTNCKQCHDEFACPRCGHTFIHHIKSDKEVCCLTPFCKNVVCYSMAHPEHGTPRPAEVASYPPVTQSDQLALPMPAPVRYDIPTAPITPYVPYNPVKKGWM